jgi:hypothetical protein
MKYISEQQLANSLRALAEFRGKVNQQGAQHILPFLALRKAGVGTKSFTKYTETDDKNFFNDFARVASGEKPYFDPIRSMYRIETHPTRTLQRCGRGHLQGRGAQPTSSKPLSLETSNGNLNLTT